MLDLVGEAQLVLPLLVPAHHAGRHLAADPAAAEAGHRVHKRHDVLVPLRRAGDDRPGEADLSRTSGTPRRACSSTGDNQFLVQTSEIEGSATTPPVGPALPSERESIETGAEQAHRRLPRCAGQPDDAVHGVLVRVGRRLDADRPERRDRRALGLGRDHAVHHVVVPQRAELAALRRLGDRRAAARRAARRRRVLDPRQVLRHRGEHVLHHGVAHGRRLLACTTRSSCSTASARTSRAASDPQLPGRGEPQPACRRWGARSTRR